MLHGTAVGGPGMGLKHSLSFGNNPSQELLLAWSSCLSIQHFFSWLVYILLGLYYLQTLVFQFFKIVTVLKQIYDIWEQLEVFTHFNTCYSFLSQLEGNRDNGSILYWKTLHA